MFCNYADHCTARIEKNGESAMKQILIIVDMQNDFIDGALGTKEAVAIVPKVEDKIRNFDGEVFFTRDTHETWYLETQEGKNLLVKHCIRGTDGWKLTPEIDVLCEGDILNKSSLRIPSNP